MSHTEQMREALEQERAALRRLTYKTDAITAMLEAIHRLLDRISAA